MEQEYILEEPSITVVEEQPGASRSNMSQQGASGFSLPPDMPRGGQFQHTVAHVKQNESIIQWFDRAVEEELNKHRLNTDGHLDVTQGMAHQSMAHSMASGVEIMGELGDIRNTELKEAAESLAQAEAVIAYEGAVRAAELAASQVAPEFAEAAAVAGAKNYQAEITGILNQEHRGDRPIEVVGYVGITKPRYPTRSKNPNQ